MYGIIKNKCIEIGVDWMLKLMQVFNNNRKTRQK